MITTNIDPIPFFRKKGRPLSFDREDALHKAMLLFWRHGYEATSLNDLTTTLGIKPSSIYSVFGDKKRLFLEAVSKYLSGPISSESIIDAAADGREAALALLRAAAIGFTGQDTPAGCLLASSAISCSEAAGDVKEELAAIRRGIEARLRDKVISSVKAGQLPGDTHAENLAGLTMAVIQGMSTLARDGAPRDKLIRLVETTMLAWPEAKNSSNRAKAI